MSNEEKAITAKDRAKVTRSISTSLWITNGVDELAAKVTEEVGLHCDRSKIINALCEILIDCRDCFDPQKGYSNIGSGDGLKRTIIDAYIKKFAETKTD